ncbi:hypothetical protein P3T18_001943 [Paraburkholderia sp. GAS199]|uniref:hypothetical protein n=1 Tax=Paraburkholderia sp. GAS199 TaxID=3035126 RepID=UPI003D2141FB
MTVNSIPHVAKNLDETLVMWRYLDMAKFLDLLENRALFFCRADKFEDKFEGAFTASAKHAIEEAFQKESTGLTFDEFKERLRKRVFVNCWRGSGDDSMAMWSLYGRSTAAVAVTTTVSQLRTSLKIPFPYQSEIKQVRYVKHWRDPALQYEPYANVFTYKVKAYEYEEEVRVLIDRYEENIEDSDLPPGMSIPVVLADLIRSIVIHPEAQGWFESLIRNIVQRYGLPVEVRRSKLAYDPI